MQVYGSAGKRGQRTIGHSWVSFIKAGEKKNRVNKLHSDKGIIDNVWASNLGHCIEKRHSQGRRTVILGKGET